MRAALRLAARGEGYVEPNPMVGCLVVRGGRVLAGGYHRRFGGPHAEVEALSRCGSAARGATIYVTLEPCCIFGKTPPCTDALITARVGEVVAAVNDPNPRIAGRGLRTLSAAGIRVRTGVCAKDARRLIAPFHKLTTTGRPWVILKWAQSLDGCIATRSGDSRWITDAAARRHAHSVRGRVDAILVGIGTVLTDDPSLTCRAVRPRRIATRVVLDSHLRLPLRSRLVRTAPRVPTIIFCGPDAGRLRRRALEAAGCEVLPISAGRAGLSLKAALQALGHRGLTNVLVEGGGTIASSFWDQQLVDECHVYVAPLLIGGQGAPRPLAGIGPASLKNAVRLPADATQRRLGSGWLIQARLH